jgi:hypothetical protein
VLHPHPPITLEASPASTFPHKSARGGERGGYIAAAPLGVLTLPCLHMNTHTHTHTQRERHTHPRAHGATTLASVGYTGWKN